MMKARQFCPALILAVVGPARADDTTDGGGALSREASGGLKPHSASLATDGVVRRGGIDFRIP